MNRPHFLQYDIPEVNRRPVCDNPSNDLWDNKCVRITYSCWLVMEDTLRRPRMMMLLNNLTQHGVRWYAIPFDVSAAEQLRAMALANIQRELAALLERARQTRDEAQTRFDDESDTQYIARRRRYLSAARAIEKRVNETIARVIPAAQEFGISELELQASTAAGEVELIANNMRARAAAFATAHGILTRRAPNHEVTRAVRSGEMDIRIAGDFLREIDENEVADNIFDSFGVI